MGTQANRVDLTAPWEKADMIKKIRANHAMTMDMLRDHLCREVVRKVTEGRTDAVLTHEIRQVLRSTLERAGFSADRKTLERYL